MFSAVKKKQDTVLPDQLFLRHEVFKIDELGLTQQIEGFKIDELGQTQQLELSM